MELALSSIFSDNQRPPCRWRPWRRRAIGGVSASWLPAMILKVRDAELREFFAVNFIL